MRSQEKERSTVLYDLSSAMILVQKLSRSRSRPSPVALASMFLGIWAGLMLFGSVSFVIGLVLLPWIVGLGFLLCCAAIFSNLSQFCCSVLFYAPFCQNHVAVLGWKLGWRKRNREIMCMFLPFSYVQKFLTLVETMEESMAV